MRTVHETEALRPSDPVPKHHSSNPSNKFQRIKLVLNESKKGIEKGSTPASPSSHAPTGAVAPLTGDAEYAHNNVTYLQDLSAPDAPTMVQFPPDINFTERELALPAPHLFRLLRQQLLWATQEGEQLRAEEKALESKRKDEWVAKELLVENVMEAEHAKGTRKLIEAGLAHEPDFLALLDSDIAPAKGLTIEAKDGKLPWWREENALDRPVQSKEMGDERKPDVEWTESIAPSAEAV